MCEEAIAKFDPFINKQHLQECLKRLLVFYDAYEVERDDVNINFIEYTVNRPLIESLYLILNLGDSNALFRAVNLPKKWR